MRGFNAIAPPLRGYQPTYIPLNGIYRIDEQAKDIIHLIEQMGLSDHQTVHIIGHDWGSPMVQYAAKLRPDLFKSVTLVSVPETQIMQKAFKSNLI